MAAAGMAGRNCRGVALVMVLLVVALIAIVATQLGSRIQLNIQQAGNRAQYHQAYWYALGGERLARGLIEAGLAADERIHLQQAWSSALLSYPIDGGLMQVRVQDQRSCFNVNVLSALETPQGGEPEEAPRAVRQLSALLTTLEFDPGQGGEMVEALADWVDADTLPRGLGGAEDLFYTRQTPPYLPANGPLAGTSELNFIEGFSRAEWAERDEQAQERFAQLRELLCALPDARLLLNLNTLLPEHYPLLVALFEGRFPLEAVTAAMEQRPDGGFNQVSDFLALLQSGEEETGGLETEVTDQLAVDSDFFLARVEVNHYDANFILYTRIYVRDGKPVPYRRHYGALNE